MAYQPKPMLPADLREYAAPTFWRAHGEKVYAAIFAALVVWDAVNQINAAPQMVSAQGASEGQDGPDVRWASSPSTTAVAAPSLDCPRLVRGQWLYGAIRHAGDAEPLRAECFYGYGAQRFAP